MPVKPHLKQVRRFCQILCLFAFLFLFRKTDYSGEDIIPYAVNILFRLDPLVLAAVTLAEKIFVSLLWPSLIVVGLTLLFGRVFCSFLCPLGTLIDLSGRVIRPQNRWRTDLGYLKYMVLAVILISALMGIQLVGLVDPFSILVRGLTFSLDPMMNFLVSGLFDGIYQHGPEFVSDRTEPVYQWLKDFVLPYKQSFFSLGCLSFLMLMAVFVMERLGGRRFWCRTICPLGAMLALMSKVAVFKRIPLKACAHCGLCETRCRMAAFDETGRFRFEECTLCMDCLDFCPDGITTFTFAWPRHQTPLNIQRRQVVLAGITGLALPALAHTRALSGMSQDEVIRPPGAMDEPSFSAACVRCGECMKVCINNALQPLFLEKGLDGMFTPVLVPRIGYCEFNCTLCGSVCPTGAIRKLDRSQKHSFVMGQAWFDHDKCLVYARHQSCMVCEEHCPVHVKAIQFRETILERTDDTRTTIKQPYVVAERCIGCGICEHVCPVPGVSAIRVFGNDFRKL